MSVIEIAELLTKGKVIPLEKHEGDFIIWEDNVVYKSDLPFIIKDLIVGDKLESPRYIFGCKKQENFVKIDLENVVEGLTEEGYEDMADYFDYESDSFKKANEAISIWLEENKSANTVYSEDRSYLIDLQSIIKKIEGELDER
ncbi:MAG: hypothetical protein ACRDDH_18260 [Cetobacterium sp.]|uniref:hypothetical protein n=1 Tax=Cetobacterium sp. TaxID=2071632 RepID=UPI003EE5D1BE